ncbi:MASE3 domain-containing protein [Sporomusa malonica]|uniref:Diguanylate cyclase (GGDEF) domain-containing protein n=2 Tax=Sporomusa malonica TaxID=112901 RepID=A0A1W2ELC7_9FIRM|nr:MASE3 domain-containing protein [Sporomusa malonica]SMD10474.1 diguanylate cyclase (GGDEF) domain-containing protein [Sporomusa malonica]
MSLLVNTLKANVHLAALTSGLFGILGLFSWMPQMFYMVYPSDAYLVIHTVAEISCMAIGLSVFIVVWYSWPQTQNSRDLAIAMVFLAVGLLDFAHLMSYKGMPDFITANSENKASTYWIISRLLASIGLLAAVYIPRRSKNPAFHRLYLLTVTLTTAMALILIVSLFENALIPMFLPGQGQTMEKIAFEYVIMLLNLLAIYLYGHRNPSQQSVFLLRVSLVFNFVAGMAFTLYSSAYDSFNLIGHVYKIAAYYCILRSLLQTSILRPYMRISRLNRALRSMVAKNMSLYKDTKDSERILQQAFIQLGATLATKHDLEAMLQQVVTATGTVFQCDHVYLALVENNKTLKIVAYISSFKPPERFQFDKCFMGKVFTEKKPVVIDNIEHHQERIIEAVRQAGLKSMVGAPIRHNGDVIGVLEIFSRKEREFTQHDAQFLSVFSHHAGEAIKNARAYETTVESLAELSLLYSVVKDLAVQQSPSGILTKIAEKLHNLFSANGTVAFIMHHRDDGIHTEPVFSIGFEQKEIDHLQRVFSDGKMTWPWSGLSAMDENTAGENERGLITMSVLMSRRLNILPLLASGKLQGLIVLGWNDPMQEVPPGKDLVLSTIASQTAIGLERAYLYDHFQAMALTDPLTRLANRRQLDIYLCREISRTLSYHRPLSLIMLDIDFFKKVNDTWGHLAGDVILQRMGAMIKERFRPTDMSARYGGEEFAVVLPETCLEEAANLAETFRQYIEAAKFEMDVNVITITISLGVATLESQSEWEDPKDGLIDAADQALYQAKQQGRNRVECHR